MNRWIVRRWFSVVGLGTTAALVFAVIANPFFGVVSRVADQAGSFVPLAFGLAALVTAVGIVRLVSRGQMLGFLGVSMAALRFPPVWVAIAVGLPLWSHFESFRSPGRLTSGGTQSAMLVREYTQWILGAAAAILVFGAVVSVVMRRFRQIAPLRLVGRDAGSAQEDVNWLEHDRPVRRLIDDRFGHQVIARRIAARLSRSREPQAIALLGPYGAGKTTICNLVVDNLGPSSRCRIARVSLWPFDNSEAAVRAVLDALTRELGKHVDVTSLRGVADTYVKAIENATDWWGALASLLRPSLDPEQLVKKISDVAVAAGFHLVVWVEDVDRFGGGAVDGVDPIQVDQSLSVVRALLCLLEEVQGVSVVMAGRRLRSASFDVEKLARFIEVVPRASQENVAFEIDRVRGEALSLFAAGMLDPAEPSIRSTLSAEGALAWSGEELVARFPDAPMPARDALTFLTETPRSLKQGLRDARDLWDSLSGEIDFDCLLVACILRAARPGLFVLVADSIEDLRVVPSSFGSKKQATPAVEKVELWLKDEADDRAGKAIKALLNYLFPLSRDDGSHPGVGQPQALFVREPVDYWARFLRREALDGDLSDQECLRVIRAWRQGASSDLPLRMIDERQSLQIKQFVRELDSSSLLRLTKSTFELVAESSFEFRFSERRYPPALLTLRGMAEKIRTPEKDLAQLLIELARVFIPVNLPVVEVLLDLYVSQEGGAWPDLLSRSAARSIQSAVELELSTAFEIGGPNTLARAIRGQPWVVYDLARGHARTAGVSDAELPFPAWREFADSLLRLAETQPMIGVPAVLRFVVINSGNSEADESRSRLKFDLETATRLFDFARLRPVLSDFEPPPSLEPLLAEMAAVVQRAVRDLPDQSASLPDSR